MFEIDEIELCPYPEFLYAEKKNRPGFVNISPTLVIDTKGLHEYYNMGTKKFDFFQISLKLNTTCILTCAEELKSFK